MRYVSAIPAYGRDYYTEEDVLKAWQEGRDFLTQDIYIFGYINKEDKPNDIILKIRYDHLREIVIIGPDGNPIDEEGELNGS